MKAILCDNAWREKWDGFVKNNSSDFGLLQSFYWNDFQTVLGREVFPLAVIKDNQILAVANIIKTPLKLGKSYFYIPRGPVLKCHPELDSGSRVKKNKIMNQAQDDKSVEGFLFDNIKELAEKEGAIFTRFELVDFKTTPNPSLERRGIRFVGQVQPKQTLILDLEKTEAELLKQMKSKTRYNIKVAQKHQIKTDTGENYFNDFWRLTQKTSSRQEIKPHGQDYYQKMLETLGEEGILKLKVAKFQGKVIAANLMIYFGDWAVYLHGASDYEYRKYMAPFLLQWRAIQEAKSGHQKYYDFWGVDETKWPGVTRFKQGFSPEKSFTKYSGAADEIYSKIWYNIYRIFR